MNKIDRYKILIRYAVYNDIAASQRDFGKKLGYTNESSFSQIINGKVREPKDFINKINDLIPDLNSNWLLTGKGEMLKSDLAVEMGSAQTSAQNPMTLSYAIPVYNLDAVAGMHSPNDVVDTSAYIERWIQFPGAHEGDIAFPVSNDSMIPKYLPGSLLQVRRVEKWQEYFGYGNSFVIFLTDGRRVLKEIQRSEEDSATKVLCVSCNAKYPPEELPKSLIRDVYKVIKSLSDEGF